MTNKDQDTEVILDEEYEFCVDEVLPPEYKMCGLISEWLKTNLENLQDDYGHKIFNKVNYGYNEETLKSFGKKPVVDVYVDNIEYDSDFQYNSPVKAHTIIIFHIKGGNSDNSYLAACQIHDYLMNKFLTEKDWRELNNVISETVITNSQLLNHPRSGWAVMGAFELEHTLYRF